MPKKIHAGYLAEVAQVHRDLWTTLAGCRVHHANHGEGRLLRNESREENILVRFGKDCIAIGRRALYNGQTRIELPDKLLRLLSKDLDGVDKTKVDRFDIELLRAKGRLIALEKQAEKRRKKSSTKPVKAKSLGKKPKAARKKKKAKNKPRYQDMMTRGKRLPGSYGTGKRR